MPAKQPYSSGMQRFGREKKGRSCYEKAFFANSSVRATSRHPILWGRAQPGRVEPSNPVPRRRSTRGRSRVRVRAKRRKKRALSN